MFNRKSRLVCSIAGVLAAGAAVGWGADPVQEDARIRELQAKVAALESRQAQNSKDLAATADAVLRDAEKRSQLLANGEMGAGYDNGFYIRSGSDFYFHPWLQFQFRNVTNWRQEAKHDGQEDNTQNGFEVRRMKFGFDGHVFSPNLTYQFLWATDRNSGTPKLEEAWAKYMFADQWGLRLGQIKDPVAHEGLVSSKRLLAVERTFLQDTLGLGDNFVQAVTLIYQDNKGPIRVEGGFSDGVGSANTDFTNTITNADGTTKRSGNFGVAGRVEYKAFGNWKSYDDFTALGNKEDLLVFGLAGDWTQNGDTNAILHTADVQWENASGLALYGAFLGRAVQNGLTPGGAVEDFYDWGAMAQAAYLIDQKWEVFARYDYTTLDDAALASDVQGKVHEITAGVNYYMHGQAAKFTLDVTWLPNGAPKDDTGADILKNNDKDELMLRAQFQLLI
ncbi:MAG: porin [Planctomycetota bacterium]|nr:porin [Planctomycetota bacterium]